MPLANCLIGKTANNLSLMKGKFAATHAKTINNQIAAV
jgi:hypothetical protein